MAPIQRGASPLPNSPNTSASPNTSTTQPPPKASNIPHEDPIQEDDIKTVNFEFVEEPLGLTADQGYGYLQVDFGDVMGLDQRYKVLRKLGWGMNSSVWLARDRKDDLYVAIKALTGNATRLLSEGAMQELQVLQRLSSTPPIPGIGETHCLSLLSHFTHSGKDQDGDHLCIVTDVFGGSVSSLLDASPTRALPVPLAKRVLRHTLLGLAHMHRCGVVHTDLKADNIMMDQGLTASQGLDVLLTNDPPRRHPPEPSWYKEVEVAVSQPLPAPNATDALSRSFLIIDFGSAQFCDQQVVQHITPATLRAPETVLKGPWNEKVDIWIFGCLIFEFLTGHGLFSRKVEGDMRPEFNHLFQMMSFTGERFMPPQLQQSKAALEFFDPKTCFLKGAPYHHRLTYQEMLRRYNTVDETDMDGVAGLMSRCLRLDPKDRPSAEELVNDPWLVEA